MTTTRINLRDILDEFDAAAQKARSLAFPVRDAELQRKHVTELMQLHDRLRAIKRATTKAKREDIANEFLGVQCLARALAEELNMWIALHTGDPHAAWEALFQAQDHVSVAFRAVPNNPTIQDYARRLSTLEAILFPKLVFLSAGFEHSGGKCSVCHEPFDKCSHVEGRIYCGAVCAEIDFSAVELDHVSVVDSPRDKRCYAHSYQEEDGVWRDTMTRLPLDPQPQATGDSPGRCIECVIFTNKTSAGVDP